MTKFKIPSFTAISHYENYSDEIKLQLIKRTLSKMPETEKAVIAGRFTATAAALVLTPLWFAISVICALLVVLRIQKSALNSIDEELKGVEIDLKQIQNTYSFVGFLRSCIFSVLYVGLSFSEIPFAAGAACFFAVGHVYLFAIKNITLPKSIAIGLTPIIVAVMVVTAIQLSNGGHIAIVLAPAFFVFSTALIVNRMSLGALKLIDLHSQFENTALLSQSNLRELQQESALRADLELTAGVGYYEWHLQDDCHVWSRGAYKIYGRAFEDGMPTVAEFVERIAEQDRQTFLDKMSKAKETGVSIGHEFSFLGYDGILRHIKSQGEALVDVNGNALGFRGMIIDQTASIIAAQIINDNFEALKQEVALRED
jgi:PAS domain-containing protein